MWWMDLEREDWEALLEVNSKGDTDVDRRSRLVLAQLIHFNLAKNRWEPSAPLGYAEVERLLRKVG